MGMSLSTAESVWAWANWFLVGSLLVGVAATFALIVSGNVKEVASKRELANAIAETENAKRESATANERAEVARLETQRIKQQLAWRSLTAGQAKSFLAALPKTHHTVVAAYPTNDPEALAFLLQFVKLLQAAGWKVIGQSRTYPGQIIVGIQIPDPPNDATTALRAAMTAAGIEFLTTPLPAHAMHFGDSAPDPASAATLLVGSKQPSF